MSNLPRVRHLSHVRRDQKKEHRSTGEQDAEAPRQQQLKPLHQNPLAPPDRRYQKKICCLVEIEKISGVHRHQSTARETKMCEGDSSTSEPHDAPLLQTSEPQDAPPQQIQTK